MAQSVKQFSRDTVVAMEKARKFIEMQHEELIRQAMKINELQAIIRKLTCGEEKKGK